MEMKLSLIQQQKKKKKDHEQRRKIVPSIFFSLKSWVLLHLTHSSAPTWPFLRCLRELLPEEKEAFGFPYSTDLIRVNNN